MPLLEVPQLLHDMFLAAAEPVEGLYDQRVALSQYGVLERLVSVALKRHAGGLVGDDVALVYAAVHQRIYLPVQMLLARSRRSFSCAALLESVRKRSLRFRICLHSAVGTLRTPLKLFSEPNGGDHKGAPLRRRYITLWKGGNCKAIVSIFIKSRGTK